MKTCIAWDPNITKKCFWKAILRNNKACLELLFSYDSNKIIALLLYLINKIEDTHEIMGIYFWNKCTRKEIQY